MLAQLAVPFVDTSAAALAWSLDVAPQPPLATTMIALAPDASLELAVLGSSHQAMLRRHGETLCETVSCHLHDETPLPAAAARTLPIGGYTFASQVDRLGPDAFSAVVGATVRRLADRETALVARFGEQPEAVTAVEATRGARGAAWRTWHAYPQTFEIVTTTTTVVFG